MVEGNWITNAFTDKNLKDLKHGWINSTLKINSIGAEQWIYFVNDCSLPQQNSFVSLIYLAHVGLNPAVAVPVKLVGVLTRTAEFTEESITKDIHIG
ncbi:hypothetical protein WISP_52603 [Willisornis vidua]|uniref:Uncharacterized protein n=1 Tax=Willisornis vidua TaxID=1566151 RepID=A0ABQ9DHP5_9PASS|nr:hypothetical protein WISP_52603 [Willisornis vidua]